MKASIIKEPNKQWWVGDERVDKQMRPVAEALDKHLEKGDAWTEIYNRAYEAVYKVLVTNK